MKTTQYLCTLNLAGNKVEFTINFEKYNHGANFQVESQNKGILLSGYVADNRLGFWTVRNEIFFSKNN